VCRSRIRKRVVAVDAVDGKTFRIFFCRDICDDLGSNKKGKGKKMYSNDQRLKTLEYAAIGAGLLLLVSCIVGCTKRTPVIPPSQTTFATPEEAGQALQNATRAEDDGSLVRILGAKSQAILYSGDPAEDKAALQSFAKKYDRMNRWVTMTDGSLVLYIGADNYPFPIPLVKDSSSKWYFNTAAGEDEVLARRVGKNELMAIDVSKSIVNAEELYRKNSHKYTQTISGNSKLAVSTSSGECPVFDGYVFRILTVPNNEAKDGSKSYISDGRMTGGFAVIASPVKYQDSGIMTFIVSQDGVVYQKDLGTQTASVAASIAEYNPSDGWTPAE
jgi:Protein of unknown function (DUF2950)